MIIEEKNTTCSDDGYGGVEYGQGFKDGPTSKKGNCFSYGKGDGNGMADGSGNGSLFTSEGEGSGFGGGTGNGGSQW